MNKILGLFFFFVVLGINMFGQFSGTAISEYQYGNLPSDTTKDFSSLYSRVLLNYQHNNLKLNTGLQLYQSPYSDRNYIDLSAASINYQNEDIFINVGNYSEVLGNGILLRNYQIPGAIIEDNGFRTKQYFYTDMLGIDVGVNFNQFSVKALWGYALNNLAPPTDDWDTRRYDELFGAEIDYRIKKHQITGSGLRVNNEFEDSYYGMVSLSGELNKKLSYYSGYASYLGGQGKTGEEKDAFAIYGNLNFILPSFGVSLEYKNYKNFLLGTGVNEPPALVKEHTYKLLNRSTHVLQPLNEQGIQLEAFYQLNIFSTLTFNYTLANNDFGRKYKYQEWFLEYSGDLFEQTEGKMFVDFAQDAFKDESDRISAGFSIDQLIKEKYGILLDFEGQNFYRFTDNVNNYYGNITVRYKSNFFIGSSVEWSNDPFATETSKIWWGGQLKYKAHVNHTFQLFAGERRGGPACSAGICYEVLDFKGVELRWVGRF